MLKMKLHLQGQSCELDIRFKIFIFFPNLKRSGIKNILIHLDAKQTNLTF